MNKEFKPKGYNSVSPYLVVEKAQQMIDLLKKIFNAKEMRKYDMPDGSIVHAEVQVDDSIIMMADATDKWPPNQLLLHVYVSDVDAVFKKAIAAGCESVQEPKEQEGDPDRRGTFKDFSGNIWSIGTQVKSEG